ncbi:MAG: hypothetical protein IKX89_01220 [Firmicutes bacterium]|nr:hypothetical protein [Bacillota bacterium]
MTEEAVVDIRKLIIDYSNDLQHRIVSFEKELRTAPIGSLRIKTRNGNSFYYVRICGHGSSSERYIPASDKAAITALARKRYIKTVLPPLQKNLLAARQFLSLHSGMEENDLAGSVPSEILDLSEEIYITPKEKARRWMMQEWTECPDYDSRPQYKTLRGEYVRSKSEAFIADTLYRHAMPYLYEKPLYLNGLRYPLFPDFTIYDPFNDKTSYWEHFGMMDNAEYAEKTCRKLSVYLNAGLVPWKDLICTFETMRVPLSSADVDMIIRSLSAA